jgi:hypothetical protein
MHIADEFGESFAQGVQEPGIADAPAQRPFYDKVDGLDVRELDALNVIRLLPVGAHQLLHLAREERPQPVPLLCCVHEDADFYVDALVSRPREHNVAKRGIHRRAKAVEVDRTRRLVVIAWAEGLRLRWGPNDVSLDLLDRCADHIDGLLEIALGYNRGIICQEWQWSQSAHVERAVQTCSRRRGHRKLVGLAPAIVNLDSWHAAFTRKWAVPLYIHSSVSFPIVAASVAWANKRSPFVDASCLCGFLSGMPIL